MAFYNRLKELRLEKKLTQRDLASILNVGRTAVVNYESGLSEPSYNLIIKLADLYNVSIDYILCRSDVRNPYGDLNVAIVEKPIAKGLFITNDEEIDIIKTWREIPLEDKVIIKGKMYESRKTKKHSTEQDLLQKKAT